MLTSANKFSNILFYREIWPNVPPQFKYPSSFHLLIHWEAEKDNRLTPVMQFATWKAAALYYPSTQVSYTERDANRKWPL